MAAGILRARLSLVKGLRSLRDGLRPPLTSEPLRALSGAPRAGHGLPLVRLRPIRLPRVRGENGVTSRQTVACAPTRPQQRTTPPWSVVAAMYWHAPGPLLPVC